MPTHSQSREELLDRVLQGAEAAVRLSEADLAELARQKRLAPTKVNKLIAFVTRLAPALAANHQSRGLIEARRQANAARKELLTKGEIIGSGELTTALAITRQALNKALQANRIFALELGGEQYYPAFYADVQYDRRKLEQVNKTLGDLPGWVKWQFFTTPKVSLGSVTPLQALANGRYQEVLNAAFGFAER